MAEFVVMPCQGFRTSQGKTLQVPPGWTLVKRKKGRAKYFQLLVCASCAHGITRLLLNSVNMRRNISSVSNESRNPKRRALPVFEMMS